MRRGFKAFAEKKAIEIRKELGLKPTEFLCVFKVCEHLKIPILDIDKLGMDEKNLNNLQGEGKSLWSAATVPVGNGKYVIVHNKLNSLARQQSDLMHEVAHIICEHKTENIEMIGDLAGLMRSYDQNQEDEAEWLGASLQLPRPALLWALKTKIGNDKICEIYSASKEMVNYRINITGVKNQVRYFR